MFAIPLKSFLERNRILYMSALPIVVAMMLITSCTNPRPCELKARSEINMDAHWLFNLGDDPSMSDASYDDTSWRVLNVPHDWAIEGEFDKHNPSGTGGGALPGGIGWYRKHFSLDELGVDTDVSKQYIVRFDGVYMNSSVYVNGHLVGVRPYGYISFQYDVTPFVNRQGDNVLAVRVDNSDQPNSRWYSGCGIFRSVYLTTVDAIHLEPWDTHLLARRQGNDKYIYWESDSIVVCINNTSSADRTLSQMVRVLDKDGKTVFTDMREVRAAAGTKTENGLPVTVVHPIRWSVDNPYLYRMCIELKDGDKVIDDYSFRYGIRDFAFVPDKGFVLNGQPMKMNGVCLHHDLGCLGSAVNRRAIQRQLEIMRGCGVNAIRCSHNPPSVELLDLCDEMGFLVMDEAFDMWRRRKTKCDYARFFDEWHEKDLSDLIRRDRNHPCVVMWSIGNEVLEQWDDAKADTLSLEQVNMILNAGHSYKTDSVLDGETNINKILARHLCDIVHRLDPTRPTTAGCNGADPRNNLFCEGGVDIVGFNYHESLFPKVPEWFPGRPFIISESVSSLHSRGHYVMPSDSIFVKPYRWDRKNEDPSLKCSAYDNCHTPWSSTHECNLHYYNDLPYIGGQFIWTGFDYIGEPTPYDWPARSSYFGIVDLAGFPKDTYYLYQSEWTDNPMLHVFPHWNWEEGQTVDIWAFYNCADEAELFINETSQGVATKGANFHACWRVTYEPGEIKVVTRKDGKEVCRQTICTAGEPAAVRLTPDRRHISADGRDLSFVTVDIVDAKGNICPNADNKVEFNVDGHAFIAGVDNGCQTSLESFKASCRKAFNGKCLVVLQNDGTKGTVRLTASSEGLKSSNVRITMK